MGADESARRLELAKAPAPVVRLAHSERLVTPADAPEADSPALLVSFVYLDRWLKLQSSTRYRDWVLDSGAFSAHRQGVEISVDEYIGVAKRLLVEDSTLVEVYALDVIGDWKASLANTRRMWRAGVPAIPCYHYGEPDDVLRGLARDFPKIALGGHAHLRGSKPKIEWMMRCFEKIWPARVHGFGAGTPVFLEALPLHSVDSTSWVLRPCKFGSWRAFGGTMSIRGSKQNLRAEVLHYLRAERTAQRRWVREMRKLAALPTVGRYSC